MNKENVISIINDLYPEKSLTTLIECPDCYVFNLNGEKYTGYANWMTINKKTGVFEYRSSFDLDTDNMKKII